MTASTSSKNHHLYIYNLILFLSAAGVALEAIADAQKSAAKKINKHRFVDTGVYRLVRYPNYLGELVISEWM